MKDLQALRALAAEEQYAEALREIEAIQQAGFRDAALLVLKGLVIQAGEGGEATLADAKAALLEAAELGENHPEAQIEAGYYALNVDDDAAAARPQFERALESLQGLVVDAVAGMAKSLQETDGDAAAARFLEGAARRVLDPEILKAKLD